MVFISLFGRLQVLEGRKEERSLDWYVMDTSGLACPSHQMTTRKSFSLIVQSQNAVSQD